MQSLKKTFTYVLMMMALAFGITAPAAASTFEEAKALAEQGDSFYQNYLGYYYQDGKGVRQDYSKAFYWFKKSADQGNLPGQFSVAYAYANGEGVRQDYSKAFYWFKKSADQNHIPAQIYIATMYEAGEGVRQNKSVAKEWYGKGCDNGDQVSCDQYKKLNLQGY